MWQVALLPLKEFMPKINIWYNLSLLYSTICLRLPSYLIAKRVCLYRFVTTLYSFCFCKSHFLNYILINCSLALFRFNVLNKNHLLNIMCPIRQSKIPPVSNRYCWILVQNIQRRFRMPLNYSLLPYNTLCNI